MNYQYENQPYVDAVLKLAIELAQSGKLGPGGLHHIMVEHDEWCPILHGTGPCICNPVVRHPTRAERRQIEKRFGNSHPKQVQS